MKKTILTTTLILGALLLHGNNALASTYFGGGLGNATWDLKPTVFGNDELEDGIAIRMFMGTRQNNIGGEMELSFSAHDWKGRGNQATHYATHLVFSGVVYIPLGTAIDLYGKAGLNLWGTTVELLGTDYEGDNGVDLALGFGLNVQATNQFSLRIEYQSLPGLSDSIDDGDVTQLTVNGVISF